MRAERKKRVAFAASLALGASTILALVLNAFNQNLVFFFSPTQVANHEAPAERAFRLGGLVETGSIKHAPDGMTVEFRVSDTNSAVVVRYTGILPDLFREGQGIVGFGRMQGDALFVADEILAKHDENYMPPDVADAIALQSANKANSI